MKPQTFALFTAAIVGGTGLLGMVDKLKKPSAEGPEDNLLNSGYRNIGGVIPTNHFFNWVRVGIGAMGLFAARDEKSAVIFNRTVAISYAGMSVMGVIPKANTIFGLMPIFGANIALHGGIAVAELFAEKEILVKAKSLIPFAGNSKALETVSKNRPARGGQIRSAVGSKVRPVKNLAKAMSKTITKADSVKS